VETIFTKFGQVEFKGAIRRKRASKETFKTERQAEGKYSSVKNIYREMQLAS
jgi:hypothetical protein